MSHMECGCSPTLFRPPQNKYSLPALLYALCALCELCVNSFSSASPAIPEKNHIPLLPNVLFPLQPPLRLLPRRRQTPRRQQVIPSHHFRPNKTLLDIAMNRPRRLHRGRSLSNRPRPHFRLPRCEKLDHPHQVIRRPIQPLHPRLLQSIRRQQLRASSSSISER